MQGDRQGACRMICEKCGTGEVIAIRLNPGDDVLESLNKAVKEMGIENGLIVQGIGSVYSHHHHVVSSGVNPPEEIFIRGKAPADVVCVNGMILDGRVHAHITLANDKVAYGGHLEPDTKVLTFMVVSVIPVSGHFTNWDTIGSL